MCLSPVRFISLIILSALLLTNSVWANEVFVTNEEDVPIPDLGHARSTIDLSEFPNREVTSVEVEFSIVHQYWGDLRVWLTKEGDGSYELFDDPSNSRRGTLTIRQTIPDFFDELPLDTEWHLDVWDRVSNNTGFIDSWWIRVECTDEDDDTIFHSDSSGFKCLFATFLHGTGSKRSIRILREFRDRYLSTNPIGRSLVSVYYRLSPDLTGFILRHPWLEIPLYVSIYLALGFVNSLIYVASSGKVIGLVLLSVGLILTTSFVSRSPARKSHGVSRGVGYERWR